MKKRTTKIAAALFAATLAVTGLAGTTAPVVNAAGESIVVKNVEANHSYKAYQIFTGKVDGNNLKDVTLGSDFALTRTDAEGAEVKLADELKDKFNVTCTNEADSIAAAIQEIAGEDGELTIDEARTLSAILYNYRKADATGSALTQGTKDTDGNYTYSVSDLATGYYLIADTASSYTDQETNVTSDLAQTLYMLRVVKGETVEVTAKSSVPTVTKKVASESTTTVSETSSSTSIAADGAWQDAATYNSGDYIAYKLDGTLPSTYDNFKTYYYKFNDNVINGLDIDLDSVYVYVDYANNTEELTDGVVDTNLYSTEGSTTDNLVVTFADLKTSLPKLSYGDTITVYYRAQLTGVDVIVNDDKNGSGNANKVDLTYSNNPNVDGNGTPSDDHKTTPEDKVTVFTFEFSGIKEDPNGNKLAGAEFALKDSTGKVIATKASAETTGKIDFGVTLKEGKYTVEETTPPAGFQSVGTFDVTITAVYTKNNVDEPVIDSYDIVFGKPTLSGSTAESETNIVTVVDRPTSNLPVTGDEGRALYYAFGGMVAIAALLYLLREKKNA